jgi:hypothetical protein
MEPYFCQKQRKAEELLAAVEVLALYWVQSMDCLMLALPIHSLWAVAN